MVDGSAVLDLAPYLYNYHPGYYQGMTLTNEAGRVLGRAKMSQGDRFWYTGWPEVRRHLAVIKPEDLADINGDGKRTLALIARDTQRRFGPDGVTPVDVKPGEKMLDLEVTRVREDGLMFWTRQHPRVFLDSMNVPHAGWPYHHQTVRNEQGDKQWIVNMPGDTVLLGLQERALTEADLADPDKDGRRMLYLQDYGPGDTVTVKTHVYLRRLQAGTFELRANVACTLALPGKGISLSTDGGQSWQELPVAAVAGGVKVALGLAQLGAGTVQLRVN